MDSGEDARKKRDCPHSDQSEDHGGTSPADNCSKKLRPEQQGELRQVPAKSEDKQDVFTTKLKNSGECECGATVRHMDIETSLHRLFQQDVTEERLSEHTSVLFRVGHAGDAPAIESCYREAQIANRVEVKVQAEPGDKSKSSERKNSEQEASSSSLEHWLSEAIGDEDTPPSVFSILADTASSSKEEDMPRKRLGAVALFTLAWKDSQRMLRLEWFHVDKSLPETRVLKRRMWLRLSALALMTGACLNVTDDLRIDIVEATTE